MAPLSDSAVGRIIEAVGPQYIPESLDRAHLRDVLNQCFASYQIRAGRKSRAMAVARHKRAKEIRDHADALLKQLGPDGDDVLVVELAGIYESDELYSGALGVVPPLDLDSPDAPPLHELAAGLRSVKAAAEHLLAREAKENEQSARLLLVADLAAIYRRHFWQKKAGRSRSATDGTPGGPFVRFAENVANETGIMLKPETIAKYAGATRENPLGARQEFPISTASD